MHLYLVVKLSIFDHFLGDDLPRSSDLSANNPPPVSATPTATAEKPINEKKPPLGSDDFMSMIRFHKFVIIISRNLASSLYFSIPSFVKLNFDRRIKIFFYFLNCLMLTFSSIR